MTTHQEHKSHFGYGSNISFAKMQSDMLRPLKGGYAAATEQLEPGCVGYIKGWKFDLRSENGTATIVETNNEDDRVYGVRYSLTPKQFLRLMQCENKNDDGKQVDVFFDGQETAEPAFTWRWDASPDANQSPARYYLELIVEGARQVGIPSEYVDTLVTIMTERCRFQPKPKDVKKPRT